ncbi:hypothetical protein [Spirosoma lituiforme]
MKKAERTKLSDAMASWLQLKGLTTAQEKQMDELKAIVIDICRANPTAFNKDGILAVEGVGLVKIVVNAPGLKLRSTGKNLNAVEQAGLVTILGPSYGKLSVDVTRVRDEVAKGNKTLIKALDKHEITLVQETRYDIKKPE